MQMHIGPLVATSARPAPAATAILVSIAGIVGMHMQSTCDLGPASFVCSRSRWYRYLLKEWSATLPGREFMLAGVK